MMVKLLKIIKNHQYTLLGCLSHIFNWSLTIQWIIKLNKFLSLHMNNLINNALKFYSTEYFLKAFIYIIPTTVTNYFTGLTQSITEISKQNFCY